MSALFVLRSMLISLLLLLFVVPATPVIAKKRGHRHRPGYGQVVNDLPRGYRPLRSRHGKHYYHRGIYYRNYDRGYRVVRPPAGLIIATLPLGYIDVRLGGNIYARYNDIYYRSVSRGYMVVDPPVSAPPPPQPDVTAIPANALGTVSVVVEVLNVRSGPGRLYTVVEHVAQGDALVVLATAPDWYYVRLPQGGYGWVWADFVRGAVNWPR